MSSEYDSSDSGEERSELVVRRDIGIQVNEFVNREVEKSLGLDEEVLVINEKLRGALKEEIERHKKVKMKYKAVEQELRTAEETVRDVTSIEFDLRQLLKSKEEEIELLKEKLGKFKKTRWEDEIKSRKEVDEKCVSLENEIKNLKEKYLEREKEFENSLVKVKQQVENWEERKANDMLSIAFKVSGITIKGLEPLINCLIDKVNVKQDVINRKTEEIENLRR